MSGAEDTDRVATNTAREECANVRSGPEMGFIVDEKHYVSFLYFRSV